MKKNDIIDSLSNLSLSEHNSVFLLSAQKIISSRSIKDIFNSSSPLAWLSEVSQKDILYYDYLIAQSLPNYINMVELSPLNEVWLNSALTPNSQNKIVTSNRLLEVVPDITTVLSLLASRKRKDDAKMNFDRFPITLATSHRQVRAQNYKRNPNFTNHFKVFGMSTIDTCANVLEKEIEIMLEHINIYLSILKIYQDNGLQVKDINIKISFPMVIRKYIKDNQLKIDELIMQWQEKNIEGKFNSSIYNLIWENFKSEYLIDEILIDESLIKRIWLSFHSLLKVSKNKIWNVPYIIQTDRLPWVNYYHNIAFSIHAKNSKWEEYALVDGGSTDWAQKFLNNKKEVNFVSWIGSEFIIKYYN